jgi:hypothetical protein
MSGNEIDVDDGPGHAASCASPVATATIGKFA